MKMIKRFNALIVSRKNFFSLLLIAVVGLAVYSNSFSASFHLDDYDSIVNNSDIHRFDLSGMLRSSRPVLAFSFALNYSLGRLDVTGYHLVNLLLHISNAFMLFFVILWTVQNTKEQRAESGMSRANSSRAPLYASLIFIAHPVQTQAVTYIVSRSSVLATFFCLLSLLLFIKAHKHAADSEGHGEDRRIYSLLFFAGSFISFSLALGSKQEAAIFPFVLFLYDYYFFSDGRWILMGDRAVFHFVTFGALSFGVYFGFSSQLQRFLFLDPARAISAYNNEALTSFTYFLTQLHVIPYYIKLLFLPVNLNLDYDWPITRQLDFTTAFFFMLLLSIVILAIWLFRRERLLSFGIIWFFLTLMVTSSFIVIEDVIFEHRLYLPSIGFATVMAVLISRISTLKLTRQVGNI